MEKDAGLACSTGPDFDLSCKGGNRAEAEAETRLVLFDCLYNDLFGLWNEMELQSEEDASHSFVALFNAPSDKDFTKEAMARRVRGIFYEEAELSVLKKGVAMILEGELWYSRESLSDFLLDPKSSSSLPEKVAENLTPREKEILRQIAAGDSNQEIAEGLNISHHTVKSHIYNIYKKINVPNRLQAALWVAKYL